MHNLLNISEYEFSQRQIDEDGPNDDRQNFLTTFFFCGIGLANVSYFL